MYDLIIIGGGPAGITAGIYAKRKKLNVLLLSKNFISQVGVAGAIENWPGEENISGPELMMKFKKHLDSYNVETKEEAVTSIEKNDSFTVKTQKGEHLAKTVIIATGRRPRQLNIKGESDFIGKGVVYCTTCDAPMFQNKKVFIVGGGNAGVEAAIEMKDYTDHVTLLECSSSFSADEYLIEKAKAKNIEMLNNYSLEEILGSVFVENIVIKNTLDGIKKELPAEGVFVQIGSTPITDFAEDLVELDKNGDIKIDPLTNKTKTEGLYAAGDVTFVKSKQIVIATGEGAKAALSVYDYLRR